MRILFLGDVMGRAGRTAIADRLPTFRRDWRLDAVVVNAENASSGRGLNAAQAKAILDAGADVITLGDHAFDQRDMMQAVEAEPRILRPLNFAKAAPGRGHRVVDAGGRKLLVMQVLGQVFMSRPYDDPFSAVDAVLHAHPLGRAVQATLVDVHCEATSEKMAMGHFCDGRASVVVGTHTHVPTADAQILPGGTAYQTDAGMCGDYDSVIGMDKSEPLRRFVTGMSPRAVRAGGRRGDALRDPGRNRRRHRPRAQPDPGPPRRPARPTGSGAVTWLDLPQATEAWVALAVVAGMFVLFLRETYPTEVVALGGVAALLSLGVLPYEAGREVLANPAPWTIAAMFVLMGALVRTGALDAFTRMAEARARSQPRAAIAFLMAAVVLASGFVANTPVVVVMIPVVVQLSRTLEVNPSKLLIPLSYASILGGIADADRDLDQPSGRRRRPPPRGLAPFTIFEVTPLAAILCLWGLLYIWFIAPRILPERTSLSAVLGGDRARMKYFAEAVIPPESDLVGRDVTGRAALQAQGRAPDRRDPRRPEPQAQPEGRQAGAGRTASCSAPEMAELPVAPTQQVASAHRTRSGAVETTTVEVLVTPGARLVGRTLGRAAPAAAIRCLSPRRAPARSQTCRASSTTWSSRWADTLLVEGAPEDIPPLRRRHAPAGDQCAVRRGVST